MASRKRKGTASAASKQIATQDARRTRFGTYFPHLFAYAHSFTDDDAKARSIVVESFTRVLALSNAMSDEEFPLALFGIAREICHRTGAQGVEAENGLNSREREVVALVFDAQLSRTQIASLLRLTDGDVASVLLRGLRKLRAAMTPTRAPAFFRLT